MAIYRSVPGDDEPGHRPLAVAEPVGVVTDYPRFGTYDVVIKDQCDPTADPLYVALHAAWNPDHFAVATIERPTERMKTILRAQPGSLSGRRVRSPDRGDSVTAPLVHRTCHRASPHVAPFNGCAGQFRLCPESLRCRQALQVVGAFMYVT
ncbi:hypothetical protein HC031_29300 [Planosporangium thailandense]|uniref:Uncharacterized protein n=1 Tax=Planosporangium thailandense TaxID=765197 RepID=A0ABX0Y8B7_9ACTN|nr:hypothetical protein [Planosporangium thailandense]NJC73780.1 hypothetical protein [Planosporangium thailandense]